MEKEVIRSRQNKLCKLVCSLERKKAREETGLFRFDGVKLCREALMKGVEIEYVVVCESRLCEITKSLGELLDGTCICVVSDDVFEKMSDEKSPEGVITVAKALDKLHKIATINNSGEFSHMPTGNERVFMLESIRDPGNLGTMIRTAASLGIDRLVLSSDCADIYNPKTIRGAMGALFMQNIDVLPSDVGAAERYISALRASGRRVYAAALHKESKRLDCLSLSSRDVFVVGNEGHGLSDEVTEACDSCVIIPMRSECESLNAAMAAGILMWETFRAHTEG